jgi:hypothetical protein
MHHFNGGAILNFAEGQLSDPQYDEITAHLAPQCRRCLEVVQEFRFVLRHLKHDLEMEPPAELVAWAVDLFRNSAGIRLDHDPPSDIEVMEIHDGSRVHEMFQVKKIG